MGILEQIAADVAEIKAALASGAAPAAAAAAPAASGDKPETAAQKKAREKQEAAASKPSFTAEQLRDKFLEVQGKFGDAAAKQLIADCGYDKLAKLIADAPKWQASWDAAEAKLAEEAGGDDDNGGL